MSNILTVLDMECDIFLLHKSHNRFL